MIPLWENRILARTFSKASNDTKKTDIVFLEKDSDEYIIVSSHMEEKNIPEYNEIMEKFVDTRPTIYDNTSRIMKHDVVEYIKWYLNFPKKK